MQINISIVGIGFEILFVSQFMISTAQSSETESNQFPFFATSFITIENNHKITP